MNEAQTSSELYWMFLQVAFIAKHGIMKLAEKHGLTIVQLHALGIMNPGESVPMNRLSSVLLCDASNVTGIVDRLLGAGYIEREENPADRRVKMIALTSGGEELRRDFLQELSGYELPEFKNLSAEQRDNLKEILQIILKTSAKSWK
jgi:DNA-binding MarR family transcriptional regulator